MNDPGVGLLRKARYHQKATLTELGARMGVSANTVSRAEQVAHPSTGTLARYGEALGLVLVVYYQAADGSIIR